MKTLANLSAITALAVISLLVPVQAAQKAGSAPLQDLPSSQIAELTAQECRNLGGTVKRDKVCSAGKTCKIENANGDTHTVCLEVAN
jgi:hypothetical protein